VEAGILQAIGAHDVRSPLASPYWSMTPYLLGDVAIKYMVRPRACDPNLASDAFAGTNPLPPPPALPDPATATDAQKEYLKDYLRHALEAQLPNAGACFDFFVQVRGDATAMPVNDPTTLWDEEVSVPLHVASIAIAPHDASVFAKPGAGQDFCENLSYTPWHALPAQRPLGGINRMRRVVYDAISSQRHQWNVDHHVTGATARHEPSLAEARAVLQPQRP
jgi:hypothetical protein